MATNFCNEVTIGCSLWTCPKSLHCGHYLAQERVATTISNQSPRSSRDRPRMILAIIRLAWANRPLCTEEIYNGGQRIDGTAIFHVPLLLSWCCCGTAFSLATMTTIARVALFLFVLFATVLSAPAALDKDMLLKNAQTAQALNAQFQNMSRTDKCNGESWNMFRSIQRLTTVVYQTESLPVSMASALSVLTPRGS